MHINLHARSTWIAYCLNEDQRPVVETAVQEVELHRNELHRFFCDSVQLYIY